MSQVTKPINSKEAIFYAAAELFQKKGYSATSMRELAQHVGLEASSLYSHIKSKEELLKEICMTHANRFLDGITDIRVNYHSAVKQLEAVIRLHVDIAAGSLSSVTVFNDEWKHLSEPDRTDFLKMRKLYENAVLQIIEQGIQKGEIKAVDPKIALYSFLTSLRWIHYWFKPGRISKDRLHENLKTLLLDGMKLA